MNRRNFLKFGLGGAAAMLSGAPIAALASSGAPAGGVTAKELEPILKRARVMRSKAADRGKAASFFIDDTVWVFRDLARQRPKSLWDHPFMATFKDCHEKYGLKMQLNLFYRTDFFYGMDEFSLAEMPDVYKSEFQAAKDWFKLGFHSLQEFPDYPWINIDYADLAKLLAMEQREIRRFAGEGVFTPALVPHWCPMSKDGVRALVDGGVKLMECTIGKRYAFDPENDPLPYGHGFRLQQNRKPETGVFFRESRNAAIANSVCSYNHASPEQGAMTSRTFNYLHDDETGMNFKNMFCDAPCLNLCTPETLRADTAKMLDREYLIFSDHEQYFFKDYLAYQPDYAEKIRIMCEMMKTDGRRFILMEELV